MSGNLPMDPGPRRSPRPGLLAAILVLVLIAAAGIYVAVHGPSTSAPPRADGTPTPDTGSAPTDQSASAALLAAPSPSATGGCDPGDTSQVVPSAPPTGVTWSLFDTVALPVSAAAGPLRVTGEVAACFADTPAGALIAAAQISTRYLLASNWRAVVAACVVPGAGADAYSAARAKVTADPAQAGDLGQIAGFQFSSYTPAEAVIQLVARFASGTYQTVTVAVRWWGGDWRLQLLPDGALSETAQQISNLIGFIPWGGV